MLRVAAAAGVVAVATAPALADPSSAVIAAAVATSKAPSYHLSMTNPGTGGSETDIVSKYGEAVSIQPPM
jgi:hypothetical protein